MRNPQTVQRIARPSLLASMAGFVLSRRVVVRSGEVDSGDAGDCVDAVYVCGDRFLGKHSEVPDGLGFVAEFPIECPCVLVGGSFGGLGCCVLCHVLSVQGSGSPV